MYPWNIEDLGRIIVGRPLLPVFEDVVKQQRGVSVSRYMLKKLRHWSGNIPTTKYHKLLDDFDIGFIKRLTDKDSMKNSDSINRPYGSVYDIISDLIFECCHVPEAVESILIHVWMRDTFPKTIHSMLWTEDWVKGHAELGDDHFLQVFLGNRQASPLASYPNIGKNSRTAQHDQQEVWKNFLRLLEHHYWMFYIAAFSLDLADKEANPSIPDPILFVPVEYNGIVRYPMWAFWRWFRAKAECETWGELAEKADFNNAGSTNGTEGEQLVRNWANAKPTGGSSEKCKMISWERLKRAIKHIEGPNSAPWSSFKTEICWGYGIARILQEHAARCLPTVLDFTSSEFPLKSFYQDRIELCKKNECRRIPALIAKL